VQPVAGGMRAIHLDGAPFMTPVPAMFDYDLRIRTMNDVGVDVCIVSLTCPNCYWGGPDVSLKAARIMNDDMAAARTAHPDRLRWFASLPWQYPERALPELERSVAAGASGVMVLANIDGHPLTDDAFAAIWSAIDARACRCSCTRRRRPASMRWTWCASSSRRRSASRSTPRSPSRG
jgi:aminocarboxymuconate-semialdehyde decarboxylase